MPTAARPSRPLSRASALGLVALGVLLPGLGESGCGAGAGLDGGVYHGDRTTFRVGERPPSWRRVDVDQASLAYRDDQARASVLVNARCGRKDDDTPLSALTLHLLMGTTERTIQAQETLPFDGREAMHTRLRAKLDGVALDYDVFVLKKDGCVYDFVYVGEPPAQAPGVQAFERFVAGFHTLATADGAVDDVAKSP